MIPTVATTKADNPPRTATVADNLPVSAPPNGLRMTIDENTTAIVIALAVPR